MRMIFAGLVLFFVSLIPAPALSNEYGNELFGIRIYTAMNFIVDEGEYYGVQVAIIPHSGGLSVLWRSGVGNIARPILISAVKKGNVINIIVPNTDQNSGAWTLSIKDKLIQAVGPRGLHFDLHETSLNCTSLNGR